MNKRHLGQRLFLGAAVLASLALVYAVADEITGNFTPKDYVTLSLDRARYDLERLQRAMRDQSLTPQEFMAQIHEIASCNKMVRAEGCGDSVPNAHVIDL